MGRKSKEHSKQITTLMKASLKTINLMVMECLYIRTEINTKEILEMDCMMDRDTMKLLGKDPTKDNSKMGNTMAKALSNGKTTIITKDSIKMELEMVLANLRKANNNMKGFGSMANLKPIQNLSFRNSMFPEKIHKLKQHEYFILYYIFSVCKIQCASLIVYN